VKVLIIGGTRFFGYFTARRLLADGHELTLFNRGLTPDDLGPGVRRIHGDRSDRRDFSRKLGREEFDAAIDMIAYTAADSRSAAETLAGRVGRFIHISTGSVYIVTRDFPCPLREEDFAREVLPQPAGDDAWWQYGYHKRLCEAALREAGARLGFPFMIYRIPIVFGERDYTLRAYSYFLRLEDGKPLVLPDGGFNVFTHIYQDDVARTVAANLLNPAAVGQAYNIAQPEILTLRAFVHEAARLLDREPEIVDIPWDVLTASGLGTGFSPLSTRRPFVLVIDKARRDLSFTATPFPAWLEKTIRWFREEYRGAPPEDYLRRNLEVELAGRFRAAVAPLKVKT